MFFLYQIQIDHRIFLTQQFLFHYIFTAKLHSIIELINNIQSTISQSSKFNNKYVEM